ncbi:hypothetical protein [Streptomyces sp. NPDC003015]
MPDGREVDQAELLDVAKDEDRARSPYRALRTLSTGPDPKLREMARGVLRGDLTAEQAFTDPEYTAALFSGADKIRRAGELRTDTEAGERFGEDRGASQSDTAPRTTPGQQPAEPWRHPGTDGVGGPGSLGGSRPAGPFGPR